jgi:heptaprenyl diphosphate synthase
MKHRNWTELPVEKEIKMTKTKKNVQLSLLVALGIALHVFESLLPAAQFIPVPGAKLGLANIVTLVTLVLIGYKEALAVVLLRSFLGSLIGGTFLSTTFFLSFAGALSSGAVMGLVYCWAGGRLSLFGVSICGAVTHNVAQLFVAALLIQQAGIFLYLPYLLFFALPTGYFTGIAANLLLRINHNLGYLPDNGNNHYVV